MEETVKKAARTICQSTKTIALTGAGISVESGIPDFRSPGGLWERFNPIEYGTIGAFQANPEKVWQMLQEVSDLLASARPNPAHTKLARLQELGLLHTIITQNVDYLHQEGGATSVIEYHGNAKTLSCLWCNQRYNIDELAGQMPPKCSCGKILKPDVVFFGEPIPIRALQESYELASTCRVLLIVGTSGEVFPANTIPETAKRAGATIIEVNVEPTVLTEYVTDIFLQGRAGEVVGKLVREVETLGA
jgi:NAD-dependent deacetylase